MKIVVALICLVSISAFSSEVKVKVQCQTEGPVYDGLITGPFESNEWQETCYGKVDGVATTSGFRSKIPFVIQFNGQTYSGTDMKLSLKYTPMVKGKECEPDQVAVDLSKYQYQLVEKESVGLTNPIGIAATLKYAGNFFSQSSFPMLLAVNQQSVCVIVAPK